MVVIETTLNAARSPEEHAWLMENVNNINVVFVRSGARTVSIEGKPVQSGHQLYIPSTLLIEYFINLIVPSCKNIKYIQSILYKTQLLICQTGSVEWLARWD